jgi:L-ascorbate metabolism protein UlaG (beta-lactamase superfamily)
MAIKVFGKNPSGHRLKRIESSANFRNGAFQNIEETEVMRKGVSTLKVMRDFLTKPKSTTPSSAIPSVKTDLKNIETGSPIIVWFGHSSYLIKSKGFNILVDPVFSGTASPFSFFGKAFDGSNIYSEDDMPEIDLLILTHDHYDHLDYRTVLKLEKKVNKIITSLGVGEHLEFWHINPSKITELNWWESTVINDDIHITATPARHFSGRGTRRGKTLWSSFVLQLHGNRIFAGGDSGYDKSFKEIGDKFGPFQLAILENGQYNQNWPYIHMMPEEVIKAAQDLRASTILPVHWGKFSLSLHDWNDPINRVVKAAKDANQPILTPRIGEVVAIDEYREWPVWWDFK